MDRLSGQFKVLSVLAIDFFLLHRLTGSVTAAAVVVGLIAIYGLFGGYLHIWKERAIPIRKLSHGDKTKLETAMAQLATDAKQISGIDISRMKVYLLHRDNTLNAQAYGGNCISVNRGLLDNCDLNVLQAVLAHEVSHTRNWDAEFNRVTFFSVTLLVRPLSVVSFVIFVIAFLVLLLLRFLGLRIGALIFRGATGLFRRMIFLSQRVIYVAYGSLISLLRRHCEYRSDRYACTLGYGEYLAHFLADCASGSRPRLTLSEVLYRTHPPARKRIKRLENRCVAKLRPIGTD